MTPTAEVRRGTAVGRTAARVPDPAPPSVGAGREDVHADELPGGTDSCSTRLDRAGGAAPQSRTRARTQDRPGGRSGWASARIVAALASRSLHPYGAHPSQVGELFLPSGTGPFAVAVVVHGGYWKAQYDRSLMTDLCIDLAAPRPGCVERRVPSRRRRRRLARHVPRPRRLRRPARGPGRPTRSRERRLGRALGGRTARALGGGAADPAG